MVAFRRREGASAALLTLSPSGCLHLLYRAACHTHLLRSLHPSITLPPPLPVPLPHSTGRHDNIIEIMDIMTGPPDTEDFHTLYIVMQVSQACQ